MSDPVGVNKVTREDPAGDDNFYSLELHSGEKRLSLLTFVSRGPALTKARRVAEFFGASSTSRKPRQPLNPARLLEMRHEDLRHLPRHGHGCRRGALL